MTDKEKAIVMAYTGACTLTGDKFQIFHKYIEDIMGRPIMIHEIGFLEDTIKEKSKADFIAICKDESNSENSNKWIPVSEKLPEVNQKVLVTSYGRVCYAMMTSVNGNSGYPIFRLQDSLNERVICETTLHSEFTTGRITAWMPLPQPYKVESEE